MGPTSRRGRPSVGGSTTRAPAGKKIVLLGMMTKIPVAGVVWQTMHYLIGFQRLGYDVYYVETHAVAPSMLMMSVFDRLGLDPPSAESDAQAEAHERGDYGSRRAAAFIDLQMRRFGLRDRWAFLALHDDGRCYGMSRSQLHRLYQSATLLVNLHGGTEPMPELAATGRLVYLETDPVQLQIELHHNQRWTIDFLDQHCAYFTFGENYGNPDCGLPLSDRYLLRPTRQPVVLDLWKGGPRGTGETYTTIGNWRQPLRDVMFEEETYSWSKHQEFLKFLDLPRHTPQSFELALSSYEEEDRRMLESNGWRVRDALGLSTDTQAYHDYIAGSRGEFTVAKDQNVRFRSGWFSDRSATYLASGRPVISQETGFSNVLPTGEGLFAFSSMDEIVAAVEEVKADYDRHSRMARALALDYFSHDVVLTRLLSQVGEELSGGRGRKREEKEILPFPPDMALTPVSRRPTRLSDTTVETVLGRPVPVFGGEDSGSSNSTSISIVVVTYDNLVFTRLCLESILAHTNDPGYELIVVDNGSTDGTVGYLHQLAEQHAHVAVLLNGYNAGFAPACNSGLARAAGDVFVLLNNDTVVAPGWLKLLVSKLDDPQIGLVGPVTNRIGNEAEIEAPYETWQEFLHFARERASNHKGDVLDIRMLAMFCLSMRRDVYEQVGPLDERFEVGLLEDDDYSRRVHAAGYRVVCADDAFVHHFGEASFGKLVSSGQHASILEKNRKRFEEKWGIQWQSYGRRPNADYESMANRIRQLVAETLPPDATVLVVSRGDEDLLKLAGRRGWHFPGTADGVYAGHHPADSKEAIELLEAMRIKGGQFLLFPRTGLWWLNHYAGLREHLENRYHAVVRDQSTCVIFALNRAPE